MIQRSMIHVDIMVSAAQSRINSQIELEASVVEQADNREALIQVSSKEKRL